MLTGYRQKDKFPSSLPIRSELWSPGRLIANGDLDAGGDLKGITLKL
jgi:hypothetical protein